MSSKESLAKAAVSTISALPGAGGHWGAPSHTNSSLWKPEFGAKLQHAQEASLHVFFIWNGGWNHLNLSIHLTNACAEVAARADTSHRFYAARPGWAARSCLSGWGERWTGSGKGLNLLLRLLPQPSITTPDPEARTVAGPSSPGSPSHRGSFHPGSVAQHHRLGSCLWLVQLTGGRSIFTSYELVPFSPLLALPK